MKRFLLVATLLVAALGAGLWLGTRSSGPSRYDMERAAINLELERTMLPFKVAFRVLLGGAVVLTLGGLGWGAVRWLNRRADTVYPDHAGLYPIREERLGQAKVFHDPNRTLSGSTVYATGEQDVGVRHVLPAGQESAQHQIASQAQAAQALRAAVSGSFPLPSKPDLPVNALNEQRTSRPLPEVKTLPWEPSHIERLLLEDGDADN
jgi:hypothetical protein